MNTHAEYRRHSHPLPEPPAPNTEVAASALARHRDPSRSADRKPLAPRGKGIAWVRPTELGAYLTPMGGRGVDLQAELFRRARRAPTTTTRALQRGAAHAPATTRSATGTSGLSL